MNASNLLFRRQFLMTPLNCPSLDHWNRAAHGNFNVYAHPDTGLTTVTSAKCIRQATLIGYMIDPGNPKRTNADLLNDLLYRSGSVDDVADLLHPIAGRFVLILNIRGDHFIFHDPCGLRSVFYTRYRGQAHFGSQPTLFECVMPIRKSHRYYEFKVSGYARRAEPWLPSGYSLYEDIYHLIPNHRLQVSSLEQVRYWPVRKLQGKSLHQGVQEAADLLKKIIEAGNERFPLALPLTSGWDSRLLLAACRDIAHDIYFYTLQYGRLKTSSSDIKIPVKLLRSLGFKHHLIDCRKNADPDFSRVYRKNYQPHESWEKMAWGMVETYPSDRVCVKGNGSEICRCFYYKSGRHEPIVSAEQLVETREGWEQLPFVHKQFSTWFTKTASAIGDLNIDILDLFYWEHRMGSWQAQYQLEWDIVQETFTPYSHRGLIEAMLGVSALYRCDPDYLLYKNMWEVLWPDVLRQPINPPSTLKAKTTARLIDFLNIIGIKDPVRRVYREYKGAKA
ncbi:MAG: hypothetical protein WD266_02845 [Balneolales bacterium]